MQKILKANWIFFPALFIGVIGLVILINNRSQPDIVPQLESAKAVHTINVPQLDVVPLIKTNGIVQPSQTLRSVAEVNGKIIETHPRLKKGAIVKQGELLLTIDPTDYELAISQAQASIAVNKAQLSELEVQQQNSESLLKIEQNSLTLSKKELDRKKKLFKDKSISRADYDKEQRNNLNQQKVHAGLKNTLALFPTQKQRINAELKKLQAQLATAKLNLQHTEIKMPFNGRIADVKIEVGQFVRQGELLVIADGMSKVEITAHIPINSMSQLVRSESVNIVNAFKHPQIKNALDIDALIKLDLNGNDVSWRGNVSRISDTLDAKTRTIGVIIEVDDPYKDIIPGIKPPLMKGLFVNVELRGKTQTAKLVVPRSSINNGEVHVVTEDNRLQTRKVSAGLVANGFATIDEGLKQNELIVVSDLVPAIEGMLLQPINDGKTFKHLKTAVAAGINVTPVSGAQK